jgi:hypothetical protein
MGPCVWLVGKCGKKKEQNYREVVRAHGLPMARCRNLRDLVQCLSSGEFPTFLVCGPDIGNMDGVSGPHLPLFQTADPQTDGYLTAYAECEAWFLSGSCRRYPRLPSTPGT